MEDKQKSIAAALLDIARAFETLAAALGPNDAVAIKLPKVAAPEPAPAPAAPAEQPKAELGAESDPFPPRPDTPTADHRAALATRLAEALKAKTISRQDVVDASGRGEFFKPSGVKSWAEFEATEKFLESFGA